MDTFDRLYQLHRLLRARRTPISRDDLQHSLACSSATLTRSLRFLRDYIGAPLVNHPGEGYRYAPTDADSYELPGLWFSADELRALLLLEQLLEDLQPGLLDEQLAPFRRRIRKLLEHLGPGSSAAAGRIRLLHAAARRRLTPQHLRDIAAALLSERCIEVEYAARADGRTTQRQLSPQRLLYYRENWYLIAWCHLRHELRSFAVEKLHLLGVAGEAARQLAPERLDEAIGGGFGIFAGSAEQCAELRFSAARARWVGDEIWHPQQRGEYLPDGRYRLSVPYSEPDELIGEILRHGAEVEVLAPASLRRTVAAQLRRAAEIYTDDQNLSIARDKG